jgi:hypothetical protein
MVRDNRHTSAYLFGAICPDRAVGADDIVQACETAWRFLINDPDRIRSIGSRKWACVSL